MARNSQGTIVLFNGNSVGEIVSISVDGVSADTVEVTSRYTTDHVKHHRLSDVDYGTITIVCRNPGLGSANVGGPYNGTTPYEAQLYIDYGTSADTYLCTIQTFAWRATVGELEEYTLTFKVWKPV